jgi:hypothetical protein
LNIMITANGSVYDSSYSDNLLLLIVGVSYEPIGSMPYIDRCQQRNC